MSLRYDASGNLIDGVQQMQFNGLTYDVVQGNTQGTLLASAARTASTSTPNQINYNAKGVIVFLKITAASGTGGITPRLFGIDPATGDGPTLSDAPTVITAIGNYTFIFYPGIGSNTTVKQVQSIVLPRTWGIIVVHGDTTSYTYSLGYSLIL